MPQPHKLKPIAMAVGLACTPAIALIPTVGLAQDNWEASQNRQRFDLPAGPLPRALNRLASQAGLALTYDPALAAGKTTEGLRGSFTPAEALERLLAGTELRHQFTGADTVTLARAGAQEGDGPMRLGPIRVEGTAEAPPPAFDPVEGYKADYTDALTRTPAETQELPQSVGVVTQDSMRDRAATTQDEAIEGVAGVVNRGQFGSGAIDLVQIRGFGISSTGFPGLVRDNGLLAFNNYVGDPALYDRIEVVKGPASFTSGIAVPGGYVNRVLKAPQPENFVEGSAAYGTDDLARVTLDANGTPPGDLPISRSPAAWPLSITTMLNFSETRAMNGIRFCHQCVIRVPMTSA